MISSKTYKNAAATYAANPGSGTSWQFFNDDTGAMCAVASVAAAERLGRVPTPIERVDGDYIEAFDDKLAQIDLDVRDELNAIRSAFGITRHRSIDAMAGEDPEATVALLKAAKWAARARELAQG